MNSHVTSIKHDVTSKNRKILLRPMAQSTALFSLQFLSEVSVANKSNSLSTTRPIIKKTDIFYTHNAISCGSRLTHLGRRCDGMATTHVRNQPTRSAGRHCHGCTPSEHRRPGAARRISKHWNPIPHANR